MLDLTSTQTSLKTARATAVLFCSGASAGRIQREFEAGQLSGIISAGFMGAKLTSQLLPLHPQIQIDALNVEIELLDISRHGEYYPPSVFSESGIVIISEVKALSRPGVETEALTAATTTAIALFDYLKGDGENPEIGRSKIIEAGRKGEKKRYFATPPECAVLVCSDSTAEGTREDKSGKLIIGMLEKQGAKVRHYKVLPDDKKAIQDQVLNWVSEDIQFIFTTGGTGLGPRDNTVSALKEIIERDADGITEAMRVYGQMRTPMAMMSRAVAGSIANTMVISLPGSSDGARESLEAILPAVFHARKMLKGGGH